MIGFKEACALLASAGLGAGGVVTVQQVQKPAVKRIAAKPAAARPRPVSTVASAPRPGGALQPGGIMCGPATGVAGSLGLAAWPIDAAAPTLGSLGGATSASLGGAGPAGFGLNPSGGGGLTSPLDGFLPTVPEPTSWGMMLGGFGLIGLALRRRRPGPAGPVTDA